MPRMIDFATYAGFGVGQVVGAWINGKPLYRKLLYFGNPSNNGSKQVYIVSGVKVMPIQEHCYPYPNLDQSLAPFAWAIPFRSTGSGNYAQDYSSERLVRINTDFDASGFKAYSEVIYWEPTD